MIADFGFWNAGFKFWLFLIYFVFSKIVNEERKLIARNPHFAIRNQEPGGGAI